MTWPLDHATPSDRVPQPQLHRPSRWWLVIAAVAIALFVVRVETPLREFTITKLERK